MAMTVGVVMVRCRGRRRSAWGEKGHGVVVRNGLHLEGMLLCVMGRKDLVKDNDSAITIAGRKDQCLTIG